MNTKALISASILVLLFKPKAGAPCIGETLFTKLLTAVLAPKPAAEPKLLKAVK